MSFTAEVKDELSRAEGRARQCDVAQVAAMVRVCGTLSLLGSHRFQLSLATETGSVARTVIRLLHGCYGLVTELTVRRSVLHKTRNYLIVVPDQDALVPALVDMGVLTAGRTLAREIEPALVRTDELARCYLRGAFMAGGFIADPKNEAHFEMVAQSKPFADGLTELLARFGVSARVARRRSSMVIYLKSGNDIMTFLALAGAPTSALAFEEARVVKSLRNDTNRRVNAEMANTRKTTVAASSQVALIGRLVERRGLDSLPPALRDLCELRLAHPDMSLRELGEAANPPLSKSAVAHRVRRLEELARADAEEA